MPSHAFDCEVVIDTKKNEGSVFLALPSTLFCFSSFFVFSPFLVFLPFFLSSFLSFFLSCALSLFFLHAERMQGIVVSTVPVGPLVGRSSSLYGVKGHLFPPIALARPRQTDCATYLALFWISFNLIRSLRLFTRCRRLKKKIPNFCFCLLRFCFRNFQSLDLYDNRFLANSSGSRLQVRFRKRFQPSDTTALISTQIIPNTRKKKIEQSNQ